MSILTRNLSSIFLPYRFFMTDCILLPHWRVILNNLPEKTGVILRDYNTPNREQLAYEMADLCQKKNLIFLIGADPSLAYKLDAGLHMPENLAFHLVRKSIKPRKLVTQSAHNILGLRKALNYKVNAAFLSPIYDTPSHPHIPPIKIQRLSALSHKTNLPIFALGGMDESRFKRLKYTGIYGYAGIRDFN